jgi:hypothetical protein
MQSQRGQSLVFLLGLTAALVGAFLIAFNSGQVLNQKQRLINTVDAAAYSGAVWQTRTLNFESYMNRAMVANEVAIAQSVSMRSWIEYMDVTLSNISTVTSWIPYVNAATRAISRVWAGINRGVQPVLGVAEGAISALNNQVLSNAQQLVHVGAFAASRDIANQTITANDRQNAPSGAQNALLARNSVAWLRLTSNYAGNQRTRNRDVVLRSRDGFSANRSSRFAPVPASLVVQLRKHGGTDMIGFDEWRGMDTFAMHNRRSVIFGRWRETLPVGWGGAQNHPRNSRSRGQGFHGGTYRENPNTSRLADGVRTRNPYRQTSYQGLARTRDISNPNRRDDRTLEFVVEAQRGAANVETSDTALNAGEVPLWTGAMANHRPNLHNGQMYALGQAQVYFMRPEGRRDGRREFPSLYNPYWQTRLAPVDRTSRTISAAQKRLPDPFIATP